MDALQKHDVPYGDDWDSAAVVTGWASAADQRRPWRAQIRDHIASMVAALPECTHVLELGSGPGFLAQRVLGRCPGIKSYTLLDFSAPMLALSRERLAAFPAASFVRASFKSDDWTRRIEKPLNCVLAMQSVHELRHKRHATRLYEQIKAVLTVPGLVAICDHLPYDDALRNTTLYMTEPEQHQALSTAGYSNVRTELSINGLVLYAADRTT